MILSSKDRPGRITRTRFDVSGFPNAIQDRVGAMRSGWCYRCIQVVQCARTVGQRRCSSHRRGSGDKASAAKPLSSSGSAPAQAVMAKAAKTNRTVPPSEWRAATRLVLRTTHALGRCHCLAAQNSAAHQSLARVCEKSDGEKCSTTTTLRAKVLFVGRKFSRASPDAWPGRTLPAATRSSMENWSRNLPTVLSTPVR